MKRKLLSLTLVLALVLSLVPMGAFAAAVTNASYLVKHDGFVKKDAVLFKFTQTTALVAGDVITATLPAAVVGTVANVAATDFVVTQADPDGAGAATAGAATAPSAATFNNTTKVLTLTLAAASLSSTGAGEVTVAMSSTAGENEFNAGVLDAAHTFALSTTSDTLAAPITFAANRFTSIVTLDKTTITADNSSTAEFKVYAYTAINQPIGGFNMFAQSSRGAVDVFAGTGVGAVNAAGAIPLTIQADGSITFTVKTAATGTFKVVVGTTNLVVGTNDAYQRFASGTNDSTINANTIGVVATKDITAGADSAYTISQFGTPTSVPAAGVKANNLDYYEYQFKVTTSAGAPVAGQKVTFTASDSVVTFNATEKTTDSSGLVKVRVFATKNGTYTIEAKAGDKTAGNISVQFGENGLQSLTFLDDQNKKFAQDITGEYFSFKLYDGMNNFVKVNDGTRNGTPYVGVNTAGATYTTEKVVGQINGISANEVTAQVMTEPSGSALKVKLGFSASTGNLRVFMDEFKKEGNYTLRVSLPNGTKVDVNFSVVKQGTITGLNYSYDEKQIAYNNTTGIAVSSGSAANMTLERSDANAVVKSVSVPDTNIVFTSSDTSLVIVESNGVFKAAGGLDDKAIGKKVTLTATDKTNKISKSVEIVIGGKVSAIKLGEKVVAKVGTTALVPVYFVDAAGNVLSGATTDGVTAVGVVIEKPADSIVGVSTPGNFDSNMKKTGSSIEITSNKAGKVKVQVLVTVASTPAVNYSGIAEVDFGAADVVAGKNLVLTMGSMTGFMNNTAVKSDLAPFIKDGRAFVPVSFIAGQLGGTAEFTKNAAGLVDTVTVKVGTTTVTMTIGSTTIKVVKDGKESTVTTDVAPFIKSGRTVLPFRAVAEAFGATVSFGPETGAVEWVKFQM